MHLILGLRSIRETKAADPAPERRKALINLGRSWRPSEPTSSVLCGRNASYLLALQKDCRERQGDDDWGRRATDRERILFKS